MARPTTAKRRVTIKHRYATIYYKGDWQAHDSRGACKTVEGAKRAAVVRIILEQYDRARIVDRKFGFVVLTLRRTAAGISLHFGRADGE